MKNTFYLIWLGTNNRKFSLYKVTENGDLALVLPFDIMKEEDKQNDVKYTQAAALMGMTKYPKTDRKLPQYYYEIHDDFSESQKEFKEFLRKMGVTGHANIYALTGFAPSHLASLTLD